MGDREKPENVADSDDVDPVAAAAAAERLRRQQNDALSGSGNTPGALRAIEVRGENIPVLETFGYEEWKAFLSQEETARIQCLGGVGYKLIQFAKEEPLS